MIDIPSEERQCQDPMGGFSGGEQGLLGGAKVVTWVLPFMVSRLTAEMMMVIKMILLDDLYRS